MLWRTSSLLMLLIVVFALLTVLSRSVWLSLSKMSFRAIGFFQLGIIWKLLQRGLPVSVLDRKRRFERRIVRIVVRRGRITLNELSVRKDTLALKLEVVREGLRQLFNRATAN